MSAEAIIGLSGKSRAGKDSTVEIARRLLGERVRRVAFADALRAEARNPPPGYEQYRWDGMVPYTPEGRTALQNYGSRRRDENPNYWIQKAVDTIRAGPELIWFITDVRYKNEAAAIHAIGGEVWRIVRTNPDGSIFDNGMSESQRAHPSETELDSYKYFDATVTAYSLESLEAALVPLLNKLQVVV